jgi:hypothetical protein
MKQMKLQNNKIGFEFTLQRYYICHYISFKTKNGLTESLKINMLGRVNSYPLGSIDKVDTNSLTRREAETVVAPSGRL